MKEVGAGAKFPLAAPIGNVKTRAKVDREAAAQHFVFRIARAMPFVRVQTEALGQCVIQTPPLRRAEEWALESGKEQDRRTQTRWGGQGPEVGVFQTDA